MGLKVYIDNKEIPLEKGERETIGPIIQEINEYLEKNKKIAYSIYINGRSFRENIIYNLDETVIEVVTVSESEVMLEGLKKIEIYGERYFDLLEEVATYDYGDPRAAYLEKELVGIGAWFLNLLELLKEELRMDLELPELDEYIEVLKREYVGIKEIIKQGDEECLYDLLENDIAEVIYDVLGDSEKFIKTYNELKNKMKFLS